MRHIAPCDPWPLPHKQVQKAQERARLESMPKPLKPEQQAEVDDLRAQAKGGPGCPASWRCMPAAAQHSASPTEGTQPGCQLRLVPPTCMQS